MTFSEQLPTTYPIPAYNNSIVRFTSSVPNAVKCDININSEFIFSITPSPEGVFEFNFIEIFKALVNQTEFEDSYDFDLDSDKFENDTDVFKSVDVNYFITDGEDTPTTETDDFTYKIFRAVNQIEEVRRGYYLTDENTFLLAPFFQDGKKQLTYFRGYPFEIDVYSIAGGAFDIDNTSANFYHLISIQNVNDINALEVIESTQINGNSIQISIVETVENFSLVTIQSQVTIDNYNNTVNRTNFLVVLPPYTASNQDQLEVFNVALNSTTFLDVLDNASGAYTLISVDGTAAASGESIVSSATVDSNGILLIVSNVNDELLKIDFTFNDGSQDLQGYTYVFVSSGEVKFFDIIGENSIININPFVNDSGEPSMGLTLSGGVNRIIISDGESDVESRLLFRLQTGLNRITFNDLDFVDLLVKEEDCGVYLKWFTNECNWAYFLFKASRTDRETESLGFINSNFENIDDISDTIKEVGKESIDTMTLFAFGINENELTMLGSLAESPKVYRYLYDSNDKKATALDWISQRIISSSLSINNSSRNKFDFSIEIELPPRNTMKL